MTQWQTGQTGIDELWHSTNVIPSRTSHQAQRIFTTDSRNLHRCRTLAGQGRYRDAVQSLGSVGTATPSEETRDILSSKHP